jgi:hypothetical protein
MILRYVQIIFAAYEGKEVVDPTAVGDMTALAVLCHMKMVESSHELRMNSTPQIWDQRATEGRFVLL